MYGRPNDTTANTPSANNIQRMESGEEGEIGEEDGEVAAPRTPRGRGRGGMRGGGRRGGRGRGRWGSPRSNSFRGFRNDTNPSEGIHRSHSIGGESPWNTNFRNRRDSFRTPDFANNNEPAFRPPAYDPRGGPPPPPPSHDEFGRSPINPQQQQQQQYQRGPPMDQRGVGPPMDQRGGGPPMDQRGVGSQMDQRGGGPPMDQRGGGPMDQRGGGPMDQRGGGPMDQRGGPPMDQRGGGLPMDQRGGGPPIDQRGSMMEGDPRDPRGPPMDPRGGNHRPPIAPPPPPPHMLAEAARSGNFSPFPDGRNEQFRGRNEDDSYEFQFGRNRDSFGSAEPRHFPRRDDLQHGANRRMTEPFQRDGGMMEQPRGGGGLFPEGPVSGNPDTFQQQAPGIRGNDSFGGDGMWNSNERPPQEQFQRQMNPRDGFQQQQEEEQFPPPLQRAGQPQNPREAAPFNNNGDGFPPGGPFQQQPFGQHFQRDAPVGKFQRDAPFAKPPEFGNVVPMEQGFRGGRGGRRNEFNRRKSTDRSFRDMDPPIAQTPVESKPPTETFTEPLKQVKQTTDPPPPPKPVEPKAEPQLLSCLEPRDLARARAVVLKIGDVLGLPLSTDHLPQKKEITKSMELLDIQIKSAGADTAKRKKAMEEALAYEREQANIVKEEAIAQATEQANMRLKKEETKEQAELDEFELTLSDYFKVEEEKFNSKQGEHLKVLESELAELTSKEEKKQREILNEQMIQTADDFDQRVSGLQEQLDRATSLAKKHKTRLSAIKEKASANQPLAAEQKEGSSLVSRIIAENRATAAKAHMASFGNVPDGPDDEISETSEFKDPKFNRTASEWATLTRQVTGISNALYCEPSEAPYFESNEKKHVWMAPYISEFIVNRQEKLTENWTELAKEYEERRRVFNKKMGKRSRKSSSSIPARQLLVTQIGGGSSSTVSRPNPYRRARREVRSDYEQEQLLEELKLAEAMEKRIQFGGCTIPRQVGKLERQLTPQFRNTFRAQRIDVMELERSLLNTSVWSDMEKCIFLDRWLQFPKDFRKIATFLRNKTTKDCIRFYYDSKQAVPYKSALREHHLRRKRRGITWEGTFEAAVSVGAVVKAGVSEQKPLIFMLPDNENMFRTRKFHPMKREVFDSLELDPESATMPKIEEVTRERPMKKRCLRRPLFTPSDEQSKFLKTQQDTTEVRTDDEFVQEEAAAPVARRSRQKWSADEKGIFVEMLTRQSLNSRPDWKAFSEALPSKTLDQIKNFYYDYKKPQGRNKGDRRRPRRQEEVTTPTPQADSVPATPSVEPNIPGPIAGDRSDQLYGSMSLHSIQQPSHQQHHLHHSHSYGDLYGGDRSGTSTPDPMELAWAQQLLMSQGGEAARRLLQSHQHQQQQQHHHQLLSSLMPWSQGLHGDWNEQHQHQQLLLRLQQQQQTNQQLAALGLGGFRQDDAQLALAQHLLNLQNGNGNYRNGGHGNNHPPRAPH